MTLLGMVHANHHSAIASAGAAMKRPKRLRSGVMRGWLERRDFRIMWRSWNCVRVLRRRPRAMKRKVSVVICLLQA